MNNNIIQEVKKKIYELQELITRLEQPQQTEEKKLDYVNLSEGNNEDKLTRITEQITQYDINILPTSKDSQLIRCAIVNELGDRGLKYWHIIRARADGYDEAEQTKRYVYLMSRKASINLNFGVIINRYKAAIDLYNNNLNNKEHGNN
ncbi:unknown [Bacteroides sp. CAG:875]|nr:unknown [Bacteroides sp. CAG:875]